MHRTPTPRRPAAARRPRPPHRSQHRRRHRPRPRASPYTYLVLDAWRNEAVPIESGGRFVDAPGRGFPREGRWVRTVWYAERLGHPVAIDLIDRDQAGVIVRRERIELLNAQSGRSQP